MLLLPRALARQFRAMLRRCVTPAHGRREPFVVVRSSGKGLSLEAVLSETALRLEHPGQHPDALLAFSASVLVQLEGPHDEFVTLEECNPGQGRASWTEAGTATSHDFNTVQPDGHLCFPALPARLTDPGASFRQALAEAAETAAHQVTGRAIHCLLLRGKQGQLVATDGRRLLVQGGFRFPWRDDVLVPRLDAWSGRDLPPAPLTLGRTDTQLFVRVGPWSFAMLRERADRYPPYETVMPAPASSTTRLQLSPEDLTLLKKQLPHLPGARQKPAPVTLDLGTQLVVRVAAEEGEGSVLQLPGAKRDGPAVRIETDRHSLLRAVKLGFHTIEIVNPDRPLCCRNAEKVFVWMPLSEPAPPQAPAVPVSKEKPIMPDINGKHPVSDDHAASAVDPLAEGEALKSLLSEAASRLGRLLAALKQHRRHAKVVKAAMESLRQLPPLTP